MRFALLLTATLACSTGKREEPAPMPPTQPPSNSVTYTGPKVIVSTPQGDKEVKVEVVATPPLIQKGLMFRKHLPLDAGMLFLMPSEREWPFWMKNTLIPLDMIWIGSDLRVVGVVENTTPMSEEERTVGKPSLYVLEVNGGWTKQHGVGAGTKVKFVDVPPRP